MTIFGEPDGKLHYRLINIVESGKHFLRPIKDELEKLTSRQESAMTIDHLDFEGYEDAGANGREKSRIDMQKYRQGLVLIEHLVDNERLMWTYLPIFRQLWGDTEMAICSYRPNLQSLTRMRNDYYVHILNQNKPDEAVRYIRKEMMR